MSGNVLLIIIAVWIMLSLLLFLFMYNSGNNNRLYDNYVSLNRCIEKQKPALLYFIGDDKKEIQKNQFVIANIDIEKDMVIVYCSQFFFVYNNAKLFFDDWTFIDEVDEQGDI